MKPFRYVRPGSLEEATAVLAGNAGDACVIAGGQSLLLGMKDRRERPSVLVSLQDVPETRGICYADDGTLTLGAATTYWTLHTHDLPKGAHAILPEIAGDIADVPVRRMGTVGGALCQAEPAFDFPLAAVLGDAELELASSRGTRRLAAADFLHGPRKTDLAPDEVLARIHFPASAPTVRSGFVKHRLRRFDSAIASAGCLIDVDAAGRVVAANVACGAVCPVPTRLTAVEEALVGRGVEEDLAAMARSRASDGLPDELANPMIMAGYKRDVLPVLVYRVVAAATNGRD
ncbi:Caffeine dehydrogenase subunit beta [Baekduia alba]|uniref:FAD binding domain-containing protein n=1 Tax=Baekduia alba TaxID=2997333 RepID=UPI002340F97C|nr:xanthine dehydrogenase family protein subunit M [Baekduia alba]WCB96695.1 Caffeine dehydrogenase subunit beta [Baekduia alba]